MYSLVKGKLSREELLKRKRERAAKARRESGVPTRGEYNELRKKSEEEKKARKAKRAAERYLSLIHI